MKNILLYLLFFASFNVAAQPNNYSLEFDGADSTQVLFSNLSSLNSNDGDYITLSFWMDWNDVATCMPISLKYYDLIFYNNGFGFNHSVGDVYGVADSLLAGGWHHITAVFYDAFSNENAHDFEKLYLDGVAQSLYYISPPKGGLGSPTPRNVNFSYQELLVGTIYPKDGYQFNGSMDDLSVWNGVLSDTQIQELVKCPPRGTETGLVAFWNFEEGTGTTTTDQTINGNVGNFNGGVTWSTDIPPYNCCTANPITSHPTDQSVIVGKNASFSFTDSLTSATYQWQMDTGNGYANLSNSGQFSGTDTNSLTVSTVSLRNDSSFFRCLVTDLTKCEDTTFVAALFVMCTPSPITTQPSDQSVIAGNEATFSFTDSLTAASYQWQMDGGAGYSDLSNAGQFSGTDTDSLIISSITMGINNTLYRCIVTESASCLDTTDVSTLTVNDNTSITELNISLVKLFPNPSNGIITLTLAEYSNGQIILTDILGKEVLSKRFNSNEVQLNLKSVEFKGTYFANVLDSAGNVVAIKKLIYQ